MNSRDTQRAFSLVELLVIVAVIMILSGLLLPALYRAQEKGRQASCLGNLRQLGIAAQLYWDDHDGRTFRYKTGATNNGDVYWFGWLARGSEGTRAFDPRAGALYPYLDTRQVAICPSLNYHLSSFKLKATGAAYGYGYNIHVSAALTEPALKISEARNPSQLAVLADAAQVNTFQPPASPDRPMLEEFYYISTNEPTTHFRHGRVASVLLADIHVEALHPQGGSLDLRLPGETIGRLESQFLDPR